MKKRIIALVVLMAMVIGMTSQMVSAAEAATYEVGYAKVDINPEVNGQWLRIPIAGGAETKSRLSEGKADDTGDGKVDGNDGIFATCIAITDQNGKTVLLISCDIANAYTPFVEPARQQILEKFASYGLEADRILINASHTHSGPMLVAGWESDTTFGDAYKTYKNYLVSQLVKAAGDALADRAPATMYQGSIDASDYYANENNGAERAYNTVRHYKITAVASNGAEYSYVCGDNFNQHRSVGETVTVDSVSYTVTKVESVTQADDTMQVVKFAFDNGNVPIVLVNWRAHATISKGRGDVAESTFDAYKLISGDYVTSLRHTLEDENYRAAFFQGASGNINPGSKLEAGNWLTNADEQTKHVTYGTALAEVALACLRGNMSQINEDGGEIRSTQQNYQSERKQVSEFEYMAGWLYKRANAEGSQVYTADQLYYYVDTKGEPQIYTTGDVAGTRKINDGDTLTDENGVVKYTRVSGETVIIASAFHAGAMTDGYPVNADPGMELELNAVTIGDDFSLVTAAGEPFDYYNNASSQNMWNDVGADFVLGYTNIGGGYLSSKETFAFNSDISTMANGSYETMCNNIGEGTGEAVVSKLDVMLDFLQNGEAANTTGDVCEHCQKRVAWTELTANGEMAVSNVIRGGHYCLTGDVTLSGVDAMGGANICLQLNGHTLTLKKNFVIPYGTTLSIVGNGTVAGQEATGYGGVFNVKEGGTLNLYDATLRYTGEEGSAGVGTRDDRTIQAGGILYVAGTFNMYGGLVKGTNVNGSGGAILVTATGVANIRGGEIRDKDTNQSFNAGSRSDDCIRNSGKVILSGDAKIDEIFIVDANESTTFAWGERIVFDGKYTGAVNVKYATDGTYIGQDVGDYTAGTDITLADIKINGAYNYEYRLGDGIVKVEGKASFAAIDKETGAYRYENTFSNLDNLSEGSCITLQKDVTTGLTINKNWNLELNGKTLNSLTVGDGYTVQVSDYKTADYDVSDNVYGKIKNISGTVVGAQATETSDVYLPVTEADGTSYHAVGLNIDSMALNTEKQGMYFKHTFRGDAMVKNLVEYYGVALSLDGAPTVEALQAEASEQLGENVSKSGTVVYTGFPGSEFGNDRAATSTLVSGIMKDANGYLTNKRNAGMKIYGRAYIKLVGSDTYVLGVTRQRSLQDQMEGLDAKLWGSLSQGEKNEILKAYESTAYNQVMTEWEIPNIKDPKQEQAFEEQEILRILGVGNSHTVDATTLLYEVFAKEMPEQKVMIGNMYKSGCTVAEHISYYKNSTNIYSYFTNENGKWEEKTNTTLKTGLEAEVWDYVMLHEMNVSAIHTKTYTNTNLQTHINNVKRNTIGTPTLLWNLSWANPVDLTLLQSKVDQSWIDCYEDYSGLNYTTMFSQMVAKTQKYVMTNTNLSGMAPTGTAICYARNSYTAEGVDLTDKDLYRDYTHMTDFGRLISAYVWYATITEQDKITDVKVDVIPEALREESFRNQGDLTITEEMKDVIIESVNFALANPWEVSAE